ncbi:MAG: dTDP-4-dehydrorhamnose reductase [Deltaproteobacteria bacterium]|nr:dTDP-4-dehydrorhamnose reductase [Deltaproteobacteria bacterium]MBW2104939.1 dTDP-4-dehydrorhamnose reductase [Deltaproteobacteria bacterium]
MKLLVIGENGQLGWEVCRKGKNQGFDIVALDLPDFDITEPSAVKKAVSQTGVSLVINASAYTAVDKAESEPELAFAANRDGPAYLAASCAEIGIPLIHISTDYVFDGKKNGPYLETDPVSPIGVYGRSKAAGEAVVRGRLQEHIILRTAWLYGLHGDNFVKTMLRLGKEKEALSVVADQYGCPTYAADLGDAILKIATQISEQHDITWGTYHYCGKGVTTWHGFAQAIFDLAKQYDSLMVKKVAPIATAEYPTPAKRPANCGMDCSLITKNFGIRLRPWEESLADLVHRYYQQDKHIQQDIKAEEVWHSSL